MKMILTNNSVCHCNCGAIQCKNQICRFCYEAKLKCKNKMSLHFEICKHIAIVIYNLEM